MTRKKMDKKLAGLEPHFKDVFVCKQKEMRPYLEIFVQEPQNISEQNLGTIAGIFEITDNSEDSSYIVNYLISIIKKEYYSKVRRGPIESFEAALHKANLALAKLAEHENINWLGHLNAVCIVLEKNNIHVSQTGTASAFLLRSKTLTNICEEPSETEPNPLKTFEDVLSGRMEENDKIIITTDSIFNIFSVEEIKRSALKFSEEEFIRFLKTALINELERAALLVMDIKEKDEVELPVPRRASTPNAFSQQSYVPKKRMDNEEHEAKRKVLVEELKKELEKSKEGFVDKKTGHIYIKDEEWKEKNSRGLENMMQSSKEKISDLGEKILSSAKNAGKKIGSISFSRKNKSQNEEEYFPSEKVEVADEFSEEKEPTKRTPVFPIFKEKTLLLGQKVISFLSATWFFSKSFSTNRIFLPIKKISVFLAGKIALQLRNIRGKRSSQMEKTYEEPPYNYAQKPESLMSTREDKKQWLQQLSGNERESVYEAYESPEIFREEKPGYFVPFWKKIMPDFSKFKGILSLDYHKKIYLAIAIVLIFIVPYFIVKFQNKSEKTAADSQIQVPVTADPLQDDKNVKKIENLTENYSGNGINNVINVNGKILAVNDSEIISTENSKSYPLPEEFQKPERVFEMDDLNLILIMKDNKILSFSPTSGKFQPNNISIPEGATIGGARSYLTYSYFLDSKNNQIYRYPRAEGGFGEKTNWLKDAANLEDIKSMAISGDVFITDGKNISRFYRGKKQDFAVEETATPIVFDELYMKPESENLYILDKTNSRIIKLGKDGQISAQYYNAGLGNARNFSVNEENKTAYFFDEAGVKSFNME